MIYQTAGMKNKLADFNPKPPVKEQAKQWSDSHSLERRARWRNAEGAQSN